jgi:hypothetical protein
VQGNRHRSGIVVGVYDRRTASVVDGNAHQISGCAQSEKRFEPQKGSEMERDWTAEAVKMADFCSANMRNERRGAIAWRKPGYAVLYGNDGYEQDEFSRRVVAKLKKALNRLGCNVVAFAVDSAAGSSWAMLVDLELMLTISDVIEPIPFLTALNHLVLFRQCRLELSRER